MSGLNESSCYRGAPARSLWTAEEARLVKQFLNTFSIRQWNKPYTEVDRSDPGGNWVLYIPQSGGGSSSTYASFFKLYDATTVAGTPTIGVTDGGDSGTPTNCGAIKINGTRREIPVFTQNLTDTGFYYIWLHSWIAEEAVEPWVAGPNAEIIVGAVGETDQPDNPHGTTLGYASQLLGRVSVAAVDEVKILGVPQQDYLRGGEHGEVLLGNCMGRGATLL